MTDHQNEKIQAWKKRSVDERINLIADIIYGSLYFIPPNSPSLASVTRDDWRAVARAVLMTTADIE